MDQNFTFVNTDEFLKLCEQEKIPPNIISPDSDNEWVFGTSQQQSQPSNPFYQCSQRNDYRQQRSESFFGQILEQKMKNEQEEKIIETNKKLFDTNQAKSIYLNKISQLLHGKTTKTQNKNQNQKLRQKEDRKYNLKEEDDMDQEPIGTDKLSKNRESAKNSRKRKKMYIELLETKVSELQEQLRQVRQLCQNYQDCISRYFGNFDLFEELIMIKEQWTQKANQLIQDEEIKNLQELQVEEIRIQDMQRQVNQNIINKILDNLYPFPLNYMLDEQLNSEIQWQQSQLEKQVQ